MVNRRLNRKKKEGCRWKDKCCKSINFPLEIHARIQSNYYSLLGFGINPTFHGGAPRCFLLPGKCWIQYLNPFFTREYQHINQILFSVRVTSKFIWRMAEIRIFQFSFSPIIWNTIERKGTWKRWLLSKSMEKGITLHLFVISAVGIQYTRFFRLFVVNEEKFDFMKVDRQYTKRCQWTLFFSL